MSRGLTRHAQNLCEDPGWTVSLSTLIMAEGKLQKEHGVIHVVVHACYNLSRLLVDAKNDKGSESASKKENAKNADSSQSLKNDSGQQLSMFPSGRNFR